jgi:hypothetical protein
MIIFFSYDHFVGHVAMRFSGVSYGMSVSGGLMVGAGGFLDLLLGQMFPNCRVLYSRQQSASGIPRELALWVDLIRRGMAGGGWAEGQLHQGSQPLSSPTTL